MKTWLQELIDAFESIEQEEVHYSTLYHHIETHTERKLSPSWKKTIQRRIQDYSSNSASFEKKKNEDIFELVYKKGDGIWRLRNKTAYTPTPIAPDSKNGNYKPSRNKVEVYRIIRDTKITKQLKILHSNKCQICGQAFNFNNFKYSEAHHIKPLGMPHNGPDVFENILVLCPNHHAEFDYGLIAIDVDDFRVLHKDSKNIYKGKKIKIIPDHALNADYLLYHIKNIFEKRVI